MTCDRTVPGDTKSCSAIPDVVRPARMRSRTSNSRRVKGTGLQLEPTTEALRRTHLGEKSPHQAARDDRFAGKGRPDHTRQAARLDVLVQEADGARADRVDDVGVRGRVGQDEHGRLRLGA